MRLGIFSLLGICVERWAGDGVFAAGVGGNKKKGSHWTFFMRSIGRRPRGFGGRAPGKKVAAVRNDKIKTQRLFAAFILAVRTRLEPAQARAVRGLFVLP